jgi:hypothetical protein
MKVKHTLLALVLLLGLGGIFYYLNSRPENASPDEIPKEKIFPFQPDQVEQFALEIGNESAAAVERVTPAPNPSWKIVQPEGVAADHDSIQSFLNELPNLQATPLEGEAAPDWSQYGLDKPSRTFSFQLQDGTSTRLSIGGTNPGGTGHYARRSDSGPVLLLDDAENRSLLVKTLLDFRVKKILPIDPNQGERLVVHVPVAGVPREVVLTREPSGFWVLDEPRVRTDHGATGYLYVTLTGGLIQSIVRENPASLDDFGLAKPAIRVDATTPQGVTSLFVGRKAVEELGDQELFYAKSSMWPHVFTISRQVYDQITQPPVNYRNRFLFDFETENVKRVDIQGPTGDLNFEKRDSIWFNVGHLVKPQPSAAAPNAQEVKETTGELRVGDFLNDIKALRISQYPSDAPDRYAAYGLDKPWLTVKVSFGEQNQTETILFSRRSGKFYAARQGEPSIYELSPNEPEHLEAALKVLAS